MSIELQIGKAPENDIVISQQVVSRKHAKVTYVSEGVLLIEDLSSTNHTFVNDVMILKKQITPTDKVSFGSYTIDTNLLFDEVKKRINATKTDFSAEFAALRKKYDDYEKRIDQLQKGAQAKPMYIRAGFTVAAMAVSFFLISDPNLKYPVMMGAGIVGGFLSVSKKGNTQMKDEIDRLSVELQRDYKCPKCGYSLMGKRWNYWAGLGTCPQCKAKWNH